MRHIIFDESNSSNRFPIALLIKDTAFNKSELNNAYISELSRCGISVDQIIGFTLDYDANGKAPVKSIKTYLSKLLPALQSLHCEYLYCADAAYFKVLTGQKKAEPHLGYILPCTIEGFEDMKVILGINHRSLLYNPANEEKLLRSVDTLIKSCQGGYIPVGQDIIKFAEYPKTLETIKQWLQKLVDFPQLVVDIETAGLRFEKAGIATISFCWSQHEGIAFAVDYMEVKGADARMRHNPVVKKYLRQFFESYKGTLIFHNCTFDTKVLIYELWMQDLLDTEGLLTGLECLYRDTEDTKIIAYLATNSTAGNKLSLKDLAHSFAGNWAQEDIKNVLKIPLKQLLEYNLVDGLSTKYVYKTYRPRMVEDQQEDIYLNLMMPSQKVITQMELTGMPLDINQVAKARKELETISDTHNKTILASSLIKETEDILTKKAWKKDYKDRKEKAKNPDKIFPKDKESYPRVNFNPNSPNQLQVLFYDVMGLPVIDKTETKQPATGADTVKKLINHTEDAQYQELLQAIIKYGKAQKILTTFIPAFENSLLKEDGHHYLHGSFNLGGTVSGRMSSSDPNLQQIPSGSTYGKLIKECIKAPEGYVFVGADFNALEARIGALVTKDPEKLSIYTDGYDSHCFNTFGYWPEKCKGITKTVSSINSIAEKYPDLRRDSKTITFAAQYGGTWITFMNSGGFTEEEAKQIEANYHALYKASDNWIQGELDKAANQGYVTGAFGLRLRTPLLKRTLKDRKSTPYKAKEESRTAGNFLGGQSYGLLNNRACNEFMQKVWASPYGNEIKPVAMIHDAIYLMIKDDIKILEFVNRELTRSMEWQELPEIKHNEVKLGAELDVFYPHWANAITLPNGIDRKEIKAICMDKFTAYMNKENQ